MNLTGDALRHGQRGVAELARAGGSVGHDQVALAMETQRSLERGLIELKGQQLAGGALDPDALGALAVSAREQSFRHRARVLDARLAELGPLVDEESGSFGNEVQRTFAMSLLWDELYALTPRLAALRSAVSMIEHTMDRKIAAASAAIAARGTPAADVTAAHNQARAEALTEAEAALTRVLTDHAVDRLFQQVSEQLRESRIAGVVIQIVALVGVGAVGGLAGAAVRGLVTGSRLATAATSAAELAATTRSARRMGIGYGLAADALVNTAGQDAVLGEQGDGLGFNLLSNVAVLAALRPLHNAVATWRAGPAALEAEHLGLWRRVGRGGTIVLTEGTIVSGEMITAAAVGYALERTRDALTGGAPPDQATASSWALQGAAMALGRYVSGRLAGLEARLEHTAAMGAHLRTRTRALAARADAIAKLGDHDAALELLIDHHKLVVAEGELLVRLVDDARIAPGSLAALQAGHDRAATGEHDLTLATVSLRLAGLTPDDPSGTRWAGQHQDITIALDQVGRAGFSVDVLRQGRLGEDWQVMLAGQAIVIHVTPLRGRAPEADGASSPARAAHARRYAAAAANLRAVREARFKADLEARPVIETDHVQVGYGPAGVMNQATLPESGAGLGDRLVVYEHDGPLAGHDDLPLGQPAGALDTPGIRVSDQADDAHGRYATSAEYQRAIEVGRDEQGTPAYRAAVIGRETRPREPGPDWLAPARRLRVHVRAADGGERWIYADRIDGATGAGPANLASLRPIAPALAALQQAGLVLTGDDPALVKKLRPDAERVLVWGGSPAGAWAAEDAIRHGSRSADLLGGVADKARRDVFLGAIREAEATGDPAAIEAAKDRYFKVAHTGAALARNQQASAGYKNDRIRVDTGTPTRIEPTGDGKVRVMIERGDEVEVAIYDQVVVAHGQDQREAGGAGALLGAHDDDGRVRLRPVLDERGRVVAVESVDPPGIRLVGAAAASRSLVDWIEPAQVDAFIAGINAMATAADTHHLTGLPVSTGSRGVASGLETQGDRIPVANEVLARGVYRLPGKDREIELDARKPETWDEDVASFLAENMRAHAARLTIVRAAGGRSGAPVWRVFVGDKELGVFKVFRTMDTAEVETQILDLLASARLQRITPVGERGLLGVDTGKPQGAVLMDSAPGHSVAEMIARLPTAPDARDPAVLRLKAAVARTAEGMADLHRAFATGETMKPGAKQKQIDTDLRHLDEARPVLGDQAWAKIRAGLEPARAAFLAADLSATAAHGDANAGNFLVDGWDPATKTFAKLGVIDVESMRATLNGGKGAWEKGGTGTAAADIGRFLESLESLKPGALTDSERRGLEKAFLNAYAEATATSDNTAFEVPDAAVTWFRIGTELVAAKHGDLTAAERLFKLLDHVGGTP